MKKIAFLLLLIPFAVMGQYVQQPDAAKIKLKLKKLNFLGSVLYMAAHPDDENTRVITYLANDRLASTAYLSLTRGDGGQNLIGAEIGDLLGLIRTQELLAARRIDGGQQFFTRAVDFGFSKSADEAFKTWGKESVLSDVVKIFRQYQPDVIITRFPPDERAGHGHHTASAVLAGEAFDVAADPQAFPETSKQFGAWQVTRLLTNTGRWWNQTINETTPGVLSLNVGGYNTLLGRSYAEISALSSSQHKSQGWGRRGERGYFAEYLEFMKGKKADKDIFEGVNTTWSRVKGGEKVQSLVDKAIADYNVENPSAIVPQLLQIRKEIDALPASVWKTRKLEETDQLIQDCLGLFIEVTASYFQGSPGQFVKSTIEVVSRGKNEVKLLDVKSAGMQWDTLYTSVLPSDKAIQIKSTVRVHPGASFSNPYWLADAHAVGLFTVKKDDLIGKPENDAAVDYVFTFSIGDQKLSIKRPLIYKWVDPVKGELWRPFEVVPPVFVTPLEKVIIFNNANPKPLNLVLKSSIEKVMKGKLTLQLPAGWRCEPASISFDLTKRDEEQTQTFSIYPSATESTGTLTATVEVDGGSYNKALQLISYDHIPTQTLLPTAEVSVVRMDLKKSGSVVGYIKGAGDEIPAALRNIGYEVVEMNDDDVTLANLKRMDAVVFGIRALNTNKRIRFYMDDLLKYVYEGGTLVVQYNTTIDLGKEKYSPFPLKLGRERVTEEDSEVRFAKPGHDVLNSPNKITPADFNGWIQERGLYFASEWDPAFEPVLSMNDKGETAKDGSLLVATYGKGKYVYSGLSFFRELPEGVTGAYKLFANIVSLGKTKNIEASKTKEKTK